MNEIDTALADVRKAYRLIYLFQKRTLDIVSRISREFQCEFYYWSPTQYARPAQGGTNPLVNRWAWDMLPMYDSSFLFLNNISNHTEHLSGDWMLEIRIQSDSGFRTNNSREPDPNDFIEVVESSTNIVLCFYYTFKDGNFNWFNQYWNDYGDYPSENQVRIDDTYNVKMLLKSHNWSEFVDEVSIVSITNAFKDLLKKQLELHSI